MFIARQPIFNSALVVYGYELLYRDSEKSVVFGGVTKSRATAEVIGNLFEIGIETITDGQKAFINFDYDSLLSDSIELIHPDNLIIEVLEDVESDNFIVERLIELKGKGYKIALDDFVEDYGKYPLVPYSDIIKYDIMATPLNTIRAEVNNALLQGKIIIAEKVETREEFEMAKDMGFNLFQGYFFKKPSIIGKSNNKKSVKLNYLMILSELNEIEPSYDIISKIIESDVNLAYRLLRIIKNNKSEDVFYTIKRSLLFMGFREIERWIHILILQDLASDKPLELMKVSLIRSKFGGSLANHSVLKSRFNEIFTMLLFSILDALLDLPMEEALDEIALTDDIRQSLIEQDGDLRPLLDLVFAYERADWDQVKLLSTELGIDEREMYDAYLDALKYCKEMVATF